MYDHQKIDFTMLRNNAIATAADIAGSLYYVGYQPIIIRHLWATVTVVTAVAALVATWKYRPTPQSDTGSSTIGTINVPIAAVVGKNYYKKLATPFTALPGSEITISFVAASGTGSVSAGMMIEPAWDSPTNNPNMIASA